MEFQDNQQDEDRLNIVLTLLVGLLGFGAWALKEIADRIRRAGPDARIGIVLVTVLLTAASIVGIGALFVSTFSRSSGSTSQASVTPALTQPALIASTPQATPITVPTVDPLIEIEERIGSLKEDISSQQAEIREAQKNAKEDVPTLKDEPREMETELKAAELERKKIRSERKNNSN